VVEKVGPDCSKQREVAERQKSEWGLVEEQ
jgi:hypothetical protein